MATHEDANQNASGPGASDGPADDESRGVGGRGADDGPDFEDNDG